MQRKRDCFRALASLPPVGEGEQTHHRRGQKSYLLKEIASQFGWSDSSIFKPAVPVFTPLECSSLLNVAFATISDQGKSSRNKNYFILPDPHSPCFMRQIEIETLYCIQTFVFGVKGSFRLPPFKWCVVNRRYQNRKSWTIKEVLQSGDSYSYQIMR